MSEAVQPAILVVEDEAIVALELEECLCALGYRVAGVAASAEEALRLVRGSVPDLALMDIHLEGPSDGIELALALREHHGVPSVILTANSDPATVQRALPALPMGYLVKPFKPRELHRAVELALFRVRAERELEVSARLRTLKVLAGGAAHELNNPLAVVSANVDWVLRTMTGWGRSPPRERELLELREALVEARDGVARAATIVRDLVTFTGQQGVGGECALESAVQWAGRTTEPLWKGSADLDVVLEPGLWVAIPEGTLAQVLVQVLSNSAWAVQAAGPGPHQVRIRANGDGPGWIRLEVGDTGVGLTPEVAERAFEPFYSGRPGFRGRGLGLSICHGLLEAAGGSIALEASTAAGCSVVMRLPRAAGLPARP